MDPVCDWIPVHCLLSSIFYLIHKQFFFLLLLFCSIEFYFSNHEYELLIWDWNWINIMNINVRHIFYRNFTTFGGKTSYRLMNRGPAWGLHKTITCKHFGYESFSPPSGCFKTRYIQVHFRAKNSLVFGLKHHVISHYLNEWWLSKICLHMVLLCPNV